MLASHYSTSTSTLALPNRTSQGTAQATAIRIYELRVQHPLAITIDVRKLSTRSSVQTRHSIASKRGKSRKPLVVRYEIVAAARPAGVRALPAPGPGT